MTTLDPTAPYVVSGRALFTTGTGYAQRTGRFVTHFDDAAIFDLAGALKFASLAIQDPHTETASVMIVPAVDDRPDNDSAIPAAALLADLEFEELAQALGEIDTSDPIAVFATLDEVQIRAMIQGGVRITGVRAGNPPKHTTNSLT